MSRVASFDGLEDLSERKSYEGGEDRGLVLSAQNHASSSVLKWRLLLSSSNNILTGIDVPENVGSVLGRLPPAWRLTGTQAHNGQGGGERSPYMRLDDFLIMKDTPDSLNILRHYTPTLVPYLCGEVSDVTEPTQLEMNQIQSFLNRHLLSQYDEVEDVPNIKNPVLSDVIESAIPWQVLQTYSVKTLDTPSFMDTWVDDGMLGILEEDPRSGLGRIMEMMFLEDDGMRWKALTCLARNWKEIDNEVVAKIKSHWSGGEAGPFDERLQPVTNLIRAWVVCIAVTAMDIRMRHDVLKTRNKSLLIDLAQRSIGLGTGLLTGQTSKEEAKEEIVRIGQETARNAIAGTLDLLDRAAHGEPVTLADCVTLCIGRKARAQRRAIKRLQQTQTTTITTTPTATATSASSGK